MRKALKAHRGNGSVLSDIRPYHGDKSGESLALNSVCTRKTQREAERPSRELRLGRNGRSGTALTEAELAEYPARAAVASRPDCRRIVTKRQRYIVSRQAQYPESETFLYERH
jgi:hypothetical protein